LERKFRVFDDGVKASQVWSWLDQGVCMCVCMCVCVCERPFACARLCMHTMQSIGETCVCSPSCSYFHMNDTFKHVRSSISKRETTHRMTRCLLCSLD
jgi:hypothetical protein